MDRQGLSGVIPMVVFERAKPTAIKQRTVARLMNSDVYLGSLEGSHRDVSQKMRRHAGVRVAH